MWIVNLLFVIININCQVFYFSSRIFKKNEEKEPTCKVHSSIFIQFEIWNLNWIRNRNPNIEQTNMTLFRSRLLFLSLFFWNCYCYCCYCWIEKWKIKLNFDRGRKEKNVTFHSLIYIYRNDEWHEKKTRKKHENFQ